MPDQGVYGKYILSKADDSEVDPEACYFVLRLDTDPAARAAMEVYADQCGNEDLAADIQACLVDLETPVCNCRERHCPHEPIFGWRSRVWQHGGSG